MIFFILTASAASAGGLDEYKAGFNSNKYGKFKEAVEHFNKAYDSGELDDETLASVCFSRAFAYRNLGDFEKALKDYDRALELDAELREDYYYHIALGAALAGAGDNDKAIEEFNSAIKINPESAPAYNGRGVALRQKGAWKDAIQDHEKSLQLSPRYWKAMNDLAWLLSTSPEQEYLDKDRALELIEQALKIRPMPDTIETAAAVYARNGDFEKAIQYQEMLIEVLKTAGMDYRIPENQARLEAYKSGSPWVDTLK